MNMEYDDASKMIRTVDVVKEGRGAYYHMLKKAKDGELVRVRPGVYATWEQLASSMIDIETIIPNSILCRFSAWSIHGLSTVIPQSIDVTILRGRRVRLPEYPSITLYYQSEPTLTLGVESMTIEGHNVKIYNVERCVCDAVKYRNKIGMEACAEILNNYLDRPQRNLSLLMNYAGKLRIANTLEKYLEIKL